MDMASNAGTYVKLYVNVEDHASITCPKCNDVKVANVKRYNGSRKPLKIQCRCGWIFHGILETRKFYRKYVKFPGSYTKVGSQNYGLMLVENLSMSGIGFRTRMQQSIKAGDILTVKFVLDNKPRTEIAKDTVVKVVMRQISSLDTCVPINGKRYSRPVWCRSVVRNMLIDRCWTRSTYGNEVPIKSPST
jgi:hypothetical protein